MSYDLYCYKQDSSRPSLEEASRFLESLNNSNITAVKNPTGIKDDVVAALIKANPRFEKFSLDYKKIAEFENSTIEEARAKYTYVELNLPESDNAIQITVQDDYVTITIPYWYGDDKSGALFKELNSYLKIINNIAGYIVYDPQANRVFDPKNDDFIDPTVYQGIIKKIPGEVEKVLQKKPWWKFW